MVIILNIISMTLNHIEIKYMLIKNVPLFIILSIYLILNKKIKYKANAVIFYLYSIILLFTDSQSDLTFTVFLIFSLYIFNTFKTIITMIMVTSLCILIKYLINDYSLVWFLTYLIGTAFVVSIYYVLIHPKDNIIVRSSFIDYTNEQIIKMTINGYSRKEISEKLYISSDAVSKRIARLKRDFGFKNGTNMQLLAYLIKKRHISL